MIWFVEQPLPIAIAGVVVCAALAAAAYSTGRGAFLIAALIAAIVTVALLALEHFVVTDVEMVEDEVYATAVAIQANDVAGVLSHVDPRAAETRSQIEAIMPRYEIRSVTVIPELKVVVSDKQKPPAAVASFSCAISASERNSGFSGSAMQRFDIRFQKEGGRWLITGYEMRGTGEEVLEHFRK